MCKLKISLSIFIALIFTFDASCQSYKKYSKEANTKIDEIPNLKNFDKPFRMNKLNTLWSKAQIRLSEPKLKSMFGELKLQDKQEILWKRLKSEGKDKDGLKEAELRTKLLNIMSMYGLLEHFEDGHIREKDGSRTSDYHLNKSLFKDKKLNKLWSKAEVAGFTSPELAALREEFNHHQDKVDQYYSLLSDAKQGPDDHHENSVDEKLDRFNTLQSADETPPNKDYLHKVNLLREQHRDLKDGYDRLHILAAKGPNSKEFVEPKVQGLWKAALDTDFTSDELESLRVELMHYENRLLKLRHLQVEQALNEERHNNKIKINGKSDGMLLLQDNIKKSARKIEKMHLDLETKIMQKHIEL